MTAQTDADTVREILRTALGPAVDEAADPSREEISAWDSLTHLEVVFMLEEEFGMRFSQDEAASLSSVSEIVRVVQSKR